MGDVYRDGGGIVTLRIFKSLKPVIGAINGAAVGIGVTMQLPMDIRMASTDARFGFVFARRGITPEAASSWFLPRLVGMQTALEWCFTGRVFNAQEALERGLVRSLHAPDELLPAARALAREIADNTAPVSVALTRQMLWRMAGAEHPMAAHRVDSRAIQARGQSADAREGVSSFLEKRTPVYPNKVSSDMPAFFPWWDEPELRVRPWTLHPDEDFDVLIVGAGISGIGAAYHLQQQCPGKRFVMLESQAGFGGTWRTHRYPGIRSDSDLFTFGYGFKPWMGTPIAGADEILEYLGEVIDENRLGAAHPLRPRASARPTGRARDSAGRSRPRARREGPGAGAARSRREVPVDVPGLLPPCRGLHAAVAGHGPLQGPHRAPADLARRPGCWTARRWWSSARARPRPR